MARQTCPPHSSSLYNSNTANSQIENIVWRLTLPSRGSKSKRLSANFKRPSLISTGRRKRGITASLETSLRFVSIVAVRNLLTEFVLNLEFV